MDNTFLPYTIPQDSFDNQETRFHDGEELVKVEMLNSVSTSLLTHGKVMFPKTPLLLAGAKVHLHPTQIEELGVKVRLLSVDEEMTARDYQNYALRGVTAVPPESRADVLGGETTLEPPTKTELEKVMPKTELATSSPLVEDTDVEEPQGDKAVEAASIRGQSKEDIKPTDAVDVEPAKDPRSTDPELAKPRTTKK